MINEMLKSRYVKHGRIFPDLDCWGLVRCMWKDGFNKPELPSMSHIDPMDKAALTDGACSVITGFGLKESEPIAGSIAAAFKGARCVHVGIVVFADMRHWILETDEPTGAVLTDMDVFASRYTKVLYYDN